MLVTLKSFTEKQTLEHQSQAARWPSRNEGDYLVRSFRSHAGNGNENAINQWYDWLNKEKLSCYTCNDDAINQWYDWSNNENNRAARLVSLLFLVSLSPKVSAYADHTQIFSIGNDSSLIHRHMQRDLLIVCEWINSNGLAVNHMINSSPCGWLMPPIHLPTISW